MVQKCVLDSLNRTNQIWIQGFSFSKTSSLSKDKKKLSLLYYLPIGGGEEREVRDSYLSFTRTMHQSTTPSLLQNIWPKWASRQFLSFPIIQTLVPVTFGYSQSSKAVVMRQLRRWKRLWPRSLTRSHKRTSMGPSRSCWNGTTSALQPEEITSKGTGVSFVYYQ